MMSSSGAFKSSCSLGHHRPDRDRLTSIIAHDSGSAGATRWRLAAWMLSGCVFLVHLIVARRQSELSRVRAAAQVAVAVGVAALVFALVGPVRSHWGEPHMSRLVLLSVILWPILTGVSAFAAAFALLFVLPRRTVQP